MAVTFNKNWTWYILKQTYKKMISFLIIFFLLLERRTHTCTVILMGYDSASQCNFNSLSFASVISFLLACIVSSRWLFSPFKESSSQSECVLLYNIVTGNKQDWKSRFLHVGIHCCKFLSSCFPWHCHIQLITSFFFFFPCFSFIVSPTTNLFPIFTQLRKWCLCCSRELLNKKQNLKK